MLVVKQCGILRAVYPRLPFITCSRTSVCLHSKVTAPLSYDIQKAFVSVDLPLKVNRYFLRNHQQKSFMSSTKSVASTNVTYEDLLRLKKKGEIFLVDVREPEEIAETGKLPGSTHIPLGELKTALETLSAGEFYKKYGVAKPGQDAPIVFSCKAGVRSVKAMELAINSGYKNSRSYGGGFMEWLEKSKN